MAVCHICKKDFENLDSHFRNNHYEKCDLCDKKFTSKKYLELHIKKVHEGQEIHKCEICGKDFDKINEFMTHVVTDHEGHKYHKCDKCGENFGQLISLKIHVESVHEKNKNVKISFKDFGHIDGLRR